MSEQITQEMLDGLNRPLPPEAIKPHPTKPYLSTIKPPFVIERLNEVFGVNGWYDSYEIVENNGPMVVAKVTLEAPQWGIKKYAFGGNNNDDRGDAYKGACTDALTKAASFLGIGLAVYKGEKPHDTPQQPSPTANKTATQVAKSAHKPAETGKVLPSPGKVENGILYCKSPIVLDAKGKNGPYLQVQYFGTFRLPDGEESRPTELLASCFHKHLFDAVRAAERKPSVFKVKENGKYTNIEDVVEIAGTEYDNGVPVIQLKHEVTDDDIPF